MSIQDFSAMRQAVRNEANEHPLDMAYCQQLYQLAKLLDDIVKMHDLHESLIEGTQPRQWLREGREHRQ